jgi:hypothetical protein
MPIPLLHRIAQARLPLALTNDPDIEAILPLILAGHVKAAMQVTFDPLGGGPQPGIVVREITPEGRRALEATAKSSVSLSPADTQAYAFHSEPPTPNPESSLDHQPLNAPKDPP